MRTRLRRWWDRLVWSVVGGVHDHDEGDEAPACQGCATNRYHRGGKQR